MSVHLLDANALFLHIPKTGGLFVEAALKAAEIRIDAWPAVREGMSFVMRPCGHICVPMISCLPSYGILLHGSRAGGDFSRPMIGSDGNRSAGTRNAVSSALRGCHFRNIWSRS